MLEALASESAIDINSTRRAQLRQALLAIIKDRMPDERAVWADFGETLVTKYLEEGRSTRHYENIADVIQDCSQGRLRLFVPQLNSDVNRQLMRPVGSAPLEVGPNDVVRGIQRPGLYLDDELLLEAWVRVR